MTIKELDTSIALIKQLAQSQIDEHKRIVNELINETEKAIKKLIEEEGYTRCEQCEGTGAIERLDSGYMRKFGLPEWDQCPVCGDGEKQWGVKGKGYYKIEEQK